MRGAGGSERAYRHDADGYTPKAHAPITSRKMVTTGRAAVTILVWPLNEHCGACSIRKQQKVLLGPSQ